MAQYNQQELHHYIYPVNTKLIWALPDCCRDRCQTCTSFHPLWKFPANSSCLQSSEMHNKDAHSSMLRINYQQFIVKYFLLKDEVITSVVTSCVFKTLGLRRHQVFKSCISQKGHSQYYKVIDQSVIWKSFISRVFMPCQIWSLCIPSQVIKIQLILFHWVLIYFCSFNIIPGVSFKFEIITKKEFLIIPK